MAPSVSGDGAHGQDWAADEALIGLYIAQLLVYNDTDMKKLYTERQGQAKPRTAEVLDDATRNGLLTLLNARLDEEWFGLAFRSGCNDGYAYAGTNYAKMKGIMAGYGLPWINDIKPTPPSAYGSANDVPALTDGQVFDLLEFCYEFVAKPEELSFHSYGGHHHYKYDPPAGRAQFAEDVNRIFERNGMAFELTLDGEVHRRAPTTLHESLGAAVFATGDALLDALLESARTKFLNHSAAVRQEAVEKLWDAWERLKTVEPGADKKEQATALLDKASAEPTLRAVLDAEAKALTDIGNVFMIRHTEMNKVPVFDAAHVDYLFHRMFSLVRLLLRKSGRGG